MKRTTEFDIPFNFWDWQDLEKATNMLAISVLESGKEYDRIIALANGGLTMVRLLADRLGTTKISSVQLSFYQGINDTKKEPQIRQPLTAKVDGQNVLLFEDIVDSGATLEFALEYLNNHGVRSVDSAALVVKPHSSIRPTFAAESETAWVIFPYEIRETLSELWQKWRASGHNDSDIRAAMLRVGFSPSDIDLYA